jgi:cytochrome c556
MRNLRVLLAAISVAMVPVTAGAFEDKDVIEYRQQVMKSLDAQTAALGMVVSTLIPEDNLVKHLDAIALAAKASVKAFEPKVQGGDSLPAVWEKWPDFSQRLNDFAEKTAQLAELARTSGREVVTSQMADALSCKPCHLAYRDNK